MARTTHTAVERLLMDDYDGTSNLHGFIETANVIVSRVYTCSVDKDMTLTTAELELIERWLAAHAYAMADQPLANKTTEGASATFQGKTGMYLEGTKYGQMALSLDYSGCLAAIASGTGRKVADLDWMGKAPSGQVDYVDRD